MYLHFFCTFLNLISLKTILGSFKELEKRNLSVFDEYGFMIKPQFKHHNYTEMEELLKSYNEIYSDITNLKSIGKSVQGRELYVLVLGNTPSKHVPGMLNYNEVLTCFLCVITTKRIL